MSEEQKTQRTLTQAEKEGIRSLAKDLGYYK